MLVWPFPNPLSHGLGEAEETHANPVRLLLSFTWLLHALQVKPARTQSFSTAEQESGSLLRPRVILHSWGSGLLCIWQFPARTGTLIDLGLPHAPCRGNITISREERTTVPFHSEDTGTRDTQVTSKAHRRTQTLTYMKSAGSFAPTSIAESLEG